MRAFIAPSILLSFAKRSSKGFVQGLQVSTGTDRVWGESGGTGGTTSKTSIAMMCSSSDPPAVTFRALSPARWPLGLDPENCKVVDIRQQLRRRGYTAPSKGQTKAKLLEELRGLVRAESFAPPDATISSDDGLTAVASATAVETTEGSDTKERQRWNPEAGWVDRSAMDRGERGYPLCRFCSEEVSSARRTFCSNGCVHEHMIRTQGSYVRKCLSTRDGGRCAECGLDAAGLYQRARAAWASGVSLSAKREAVAREMVGTPFEGKVPTEGATRRPPQGKFWHADHIVPVVRGGGQCSLKNYRTLCVPCHAAATKKLAGERAAERAKTVVTGTASTPAASTSATGAAGAAALKRKRGRPRTTAGQESSGSSTRGRSRSSSSRRRNSSRISLADALSSEELKEGAGRRKGVSEEGY